jgi:hypothetical protein
LNLIPLCDKSDKNDKNDNPTRYLFDEIGAARGAGGCSARGDAGALCVALVAIETLAWYSARHVIVIIEFFPFFSCVAANAGMRSTKEW